MALNLSFRTLKGDKFKLEANADETVSELKKKVVARYEDGDAEAYRLIYKGKILDSGKTLSAAGVTESGFIVVMPPKRAAPPKPAPKPESTASAAGVTARSSPESASAPSATAPTSAAPAPASTEPAQSSNTDASPSTANALVTGPEYNATIKRIAEMGFPEADVKRAMAAAFNNPDRAVDYLFNGIPANAAPPPAPPSTPPEGAAAAGDGAAGVHGGALDVGGTQPARPGQPFNMFQGGGDGGGGNLDFLRNQEPFNQMRRLIQADPRVVPQLLRTLEQTDPALMNLINNNREEFLQLLNTPVEGDAGGDNEQMNQLAAALAASGGGRGPSGIDPATGTIQVTAEENAMIERLTELGNSMGLQQVSVVQAWLACDKDENLAANYLLNHGDELRAQQAEDRAAIEEELRNSSQDPSGGGSGDGGQQPPPSGTN